MEGRLGVVRHHRASTERDDAEGASAALATARGTASALACHRNPLGTLLHLGRTATFAEGAAFALVELLGRIARAACCAVGIASAAAPAGEVADESRPASRAFACS